MSAIQVTKGKSLRMGETEMDGVFNLLLAGESVINVGEDGSVRIKAGVEIRYGNDSMTVPEDIVVGDVKRALSSPTVKNDGV